MSCSPCWQAAASPGRFSIRPDSKCACLLKHDTQQHPAFLHLIPFVALTRCAKIEKHCKLARLHGATCRREAPGSCTESNDRYQSSGQRSFPIWPPAAGLLVCLTWLGSHVLSHLGSEGKKMAEERRGRVLSSRGQRQRALGLDAWRRAGCSGCIANAKNGAQMTRE